MTAVPAGVTAALAGVGVAQALWGAQLVASFAQRPRANPVERPPVTVLKPLHGDEPLLEAALTTLCRQDFSAFQIVFGVADAQDPAVAVVHRLQARFPDLAIALVVDPALHGVNRKVGNLINMLPSALYDVLVIADSDVHVRPDYLERLVTALEQPGVGLVTMLYAGLPVSPELSPSWPDPPSPSSPDLSPSWPGVSAPSTAAPIGIDGPNTPGHEVRNNRKTFPSLAMRLGATQITQVFLPGALLSRTLGRQDCLGATMCLRRRDLDRIGGFPALADHLADDNVLGRRVAALGMRIALADTLVLTTVPEADVGALFRHELRWARTIRALEPAAFAASVLQYPLAWALLTTALAACAWWSIGVFVIAWLLRAIAALRTDSALERLWSAEQGSDDIVALAFNAPVWLLPLRDVLSVAVMLASYGGRQVDWRGQSLRADTPPRLNKHSANFRPIKGTDAL